MSQQKRCPNTKEIWFLCELARLLFAK